MGGHTRCKLLKTGVEPTERVALHVLFKVVDGSHGEHDCKCADEPRKLQPETFIARLGERLIMQDLSMDRVP